MLSDRSLIETKKAEAQIKAILAQVKAELIPEAHNALYNGARSIQRKVAEEANKIAYQPLTAKTSKRYTAGKVSTQKHREGKDYGKGRTNYDLKAVDANFTTKKLKDKPNNTWLRVHLRTQRGAGDDEKYFAYIKGFFAKFKGQERFSKGRARGKLKPYDFFTKVVNKNIHQVTDRLNKVLNK
jgi:hypothetical protein